MILADGEKKKESESQLKRGHDIFIHVIKEWHEFWRSTKHGYSEN